MTFPRFSHTQFALDFYPEGIKFMPSFSFGTQAGSASYETVTVLGPGNAGTARPRPENVEQLPAQRSHCTEDIWWDSPREPSVHRGVGAGGWFNRVFL